MKIQGIDGWIALMREQKMRIECAEVMFDETWREDMTPEEQMSFFARRDRHRAVEAVRKGYLEKTVAALNAALAARGTNDEADAIEKCRTARI